ncbi:MAG: adenosylcobinamide-phosphate synthase CbiB [Planctomycetota bacterium]
MNEWWIVAVALAYDVCLGELPVRVHPVVGMGRVVRLATARAPRSGLPALVAGAALAVLLPLGCAALWIAIERLLAGAPWALALLSVAVLTSTFSVRLLMQEGLVLAGMLERGEIDLARQRLSHLCSRRADELGAEELASAGLASLAENASDSFVAPWFWFLVGGVPLALAYRAINTLDAMVGYRGEYERLGKASARLDDLVNWIPARLTSLLIAAAGPLVGRAGRRALSVAARDARRTPSPNGGWPMAAMAGLLDTRLEKRDSYVLHGAGSATSAVHLRAGVRVVGWVAMLATPLLVARTLLVEGGLA